MEAFTLLRYWRTAAGTARASSTRYSHYGDDGPYFDLEFSFANNEGDTATAKDTEPENGFSVEKLSESGNDDEKMKFSGQVNFPAGGLKGWEAAGAVAPGNMKSKQGNNINLQAGLKVVFKHLSKSRSTSAAVVVSPPAEKIAANNQRCDSVVEMQDGIEGAILHCKRSFFNASRERESCVLTPSASDPSYDKSVIMPADSWASTSLHSGDVIEIEVN